MLKKLIGKKKKVLLELSKKNVDRYGRFLAHVYNEKGVNLSAELLRKGLASLLVVPPDVEKAACYKNARNKARLQRLGMWKHDKGGEVLAKNIDAAYHKGGFIRVSGKVTDVQHTQRSIWVNLQGKMRLRIKRSNWKWFYNLKPSNLKNKWVHANGYYHWYRDRAVLNLLHPAMISVIEEAR